jgi:hypothetical protein
MTKEKSGEWGINPHDGKVYVRTRDGKKKRVYNIGFTIGTRH